MTKNYVIKQNSAYLHKVGNKLEFLPKKKGACIFPAENVQLVIDTLRLEGAEGVFKCRAKPEHIRPGVTTIFQNFFTGRAKKRLTARVNKESGKG